MKGFVLCNGGTKAPPYKGYGLCSMCLCNTKAKLAIKAEKEIHLKEKKYVFIIF